jgi:CheY-like chemotaxis protein
MTKVLLLEDEVLIGMDIEDRLTALGCDVFNTIDEETALAALQAGHRFDLALIDLLLANGEAPLTLLGRLEGAQVPVVICSGGASPEATAHLPFLPKPHTDEHFRRVLEPYIGSVAPPECVAVDSSLALSCSR